jgi:integrase
MAKLHQLNKHKYLKPIEMVELEMRLDNAKRKEARNVLMIRLLIKTGARGSEMLAIRPMDLHTETQSIFIMGLKDGKDRELPVPSKLFRQLEEVATGPKDKPIFPIALRTLQGIWYDIRPVEKKLHSLRHSFAFNLYVKTKDILLVKMALGHRSVQSTMVYLEHLYEQESFERLVLVNG